MFGSKIPKKLILQSEIAVNPDAWAELIAQGYDEKKILKMTAEQIDWAWNYSKIKGIVHDIDHSEIHREEYYK